MCVLPSLCVESLQPRSLLSCGPVAALENSGTAAQHCDSTAGESAITAVPSPAQRVRHGGSVCSPWFIHTRVLARCLCTQLAPAAAAHRLLLNSLWHSPRTAQLHCTTLSPVSPMSAPGQAKAATATPAAAISDAANAAVAHHAAAASLLAAQSTPLPADYAPTINFLQQMAMQANAQSEAHMHIPQRALMSSR